jgi:hypothetical protein
MLMLVNLGPDGTLRWKAEDHRLGRSESVMGKDDTSKIVALSVLVKDRWVVPLRQVLNILITYWCYESSKLM